MGVLVSTGYIACLSETTTKSEWVNVQIRKMSRHKKCMSRLAGGSGMSE